ncbi:hypothetical protein MHTCC0001_33260 [Flavobacteriaceae bacterium MHTCC 0001]
MKTIIYATDCTINDISSLKYAYRFSCIMNANLHVLHVYNFPPITFSTIQTKKLLKKKMHEEQMELLDTYCKTHLKNEFQLKSFTTHVIENNSVSNSVLRLSKVINPDLIIIGMKDRHSTRGYFSGNIADTLLNVLEIPLLIIPNNMTYDTISTIVYATDFESKDIVFLQKVVEIAKPFSALIEVIHVYTADEYVAKTSMEYFKNTLRKKTSYPEIVFRTIPSKSIKSGLLRVLDNEEANLLAILERKHEWSFSNIFHKDLVKDMEMSLTIPLLAFNKNGKTASKSF